MINDPSCFPPLSHQAKPHENRHLPPVPMQNQNSQVKGRRRLLGTGRTTTDLGFHFWKSATASGHRVAPSISTSLVSCSVSPSRILHNLLVKCGETVLHWGGHTSLTPNPRNTFSLKCPLSTSKKEARSARQPRAGLLGHLWAPPKAPICKIKVPLESYFVHLVGFIFP